MIRQIVEATGGSVRQVCRVLRLPRSSFYHAAELTHSEKDDQRIGSLIEAVFRLHRRRYSYRRIREELADRGEACAAASIRRIMVQRGLRAIQPKNYVPKTSDDRADAGMLQSMFRRANPSDARLEIFQYIDGYYNTHLKHSSLGYLTPSQFESSLHSNN